MGFIDVYIHSLSETQRCTAGVYHGYSLVVSELQGGDVHSLRRMSGTPGVII